MSGKQIISVYLFLAELTFFYIPDRKTALNFNLKSFIFSSEPYQWCFGVSELRVDGLQIIDITDDTTGSPHDIAKRNIPMYINEVGSDRNRKRNVFINE